MHTAAPPTEVLPWIWLGGVSATKEFFVSTGITHSVSICEFIPADCILSASARLQFDVEDSDVTDLAELFPQFIKFLYDVQSQGGKVFVHCKFGASRSVTCMCAWLMVQFCISSSEALAYIKHWRPTADPNQAFLEQLKEFDGCTAKKLRKSITQDKERIREDRAWFLRSPASPDLSGTSKSRL
jgi:predicted protein tyrosine phosphatase